MTDSDDYTDEEIALMREAACACCDLAAMGGCGPLCREHPDHWAWVDEERERDAEDDEDDWEDKEE